MAESAKLPDRKNLRKLVKTQLMRSPEDHGVMMSVKCNRI